MRCGLLLSLLVALCGTADGQDLRGIKLKPGERLVAINGVPVDSKGRPVSRRQSQPSRANRVARGAAKAAVAAPAKPTVSQPAIESAPVETNVVGNLQRSGLPFSHTPGQTALDKANYERRKQGRRPLTPDPQLQSLALRKATIAAQRSYKNHIGGSLGGAKCEGVGHTNGRFLSCCLDEPGTYGGAAMVQGRDGWYCCLLVR